MVLPLVQRPSPVQVRPPEQVWSPPHSAWHFPSLQCMPVAHWVASEHDLPHSSPNRARHTSSEPVPSSSTLALPHAGALSAARLTNILRLAQARICIVWLLCDSQREKAKSKRKCTLTFLLKSPE